MTGPYELRIGDAEREAAVSALGEHYAAGRITLQEFDQRSSLGYAARTNADLWPLFRDLPELRPVAPAPPPRQGSARHRPLLAPLLLVALALLVLTHLPWPLLLVVGWLWWGRVFRHWSRGYNNGSRRAVRGSWS
jgi:hypothetical protein